MTEQRVWLARLPEMRLAYFETPLAAGDSGAAAIVPEGAWDALNEWRLRTRPALGRIDIAAIGWHAEVEGKVCYRTGVPIRSDYQPAVPARTMLFPGGSFAYACADDVDEIDEAAGAVEAWVSKGGLLAQPGFIEVYRYHYNLDQHPCDCGLLVRRADGSEPVPAAGGHASPLPIARG